MNHSSSVSRQWEGYQHSCVTTPIGSKFCNLQNEALHYIKILLLINTHVTFDPWLLKLQSKI